MSINKLSEAKEHLDMANQILREEYGIGQEPMPEEVPSEVPQTEEEPMPEENIAKKDDRIAKIREIALGGLQDYAHSVDSEQYQFYKKIWLACDKAVSEKESVGSGDVA